MMQKQEPFVIERILNAALDLVWKAITDKDEMKKWYFDLIEFKPEVGFKFQFVGGGENQYLHLCEITEVIKNKKLTYSWKYDGYEGMTYVTFELFPENGKTKIRLTHTGLETFPSSITDFARKNFEMGWTDIIGTNLINYLESK